MSLNLEFSIALYDNKNFLFIQPLLNKYLLKAYFWAFSDEQTGFMSWSRVLGLVLEKPLHVYIILGALRAALLKILL